MIETSRRCIPQECSSVDEDLLAITTDQPSSTVGPVDVTDGPGEGVALPAKGTIGVWCGVKPCPESSLGFVGGVLDVEVEVGGVAKVVLD